MTAQPSTIIRAARISKSFGGGAPVLSDVDFELRAGEIHGLLGENGAGKSTLLKILGGVHHADAGQIFVDGAPTQIPSPHAAQKMGVSLIHQEPLTFPDLDVAENIYLGHQTSWILNRRAMYRGASEILNLLGVKLNPRQRVRGLSIADQQMVELAAALSHRARVLLMDEPTAALTPREVDELFRIVRQLKESGAAIVFISHRLEEVFSICDRITVLRDGKLVGTRPTGQTNADEIIHMMVGRELGKLYDKEPAQLGAARLTVQSLSREGKFSDISFEVRRGEIVGLAGLVGAGRTDVGQTIFGVAKPTSGSVQLDAKRVSIKSPRHAIESGIAYVPEDRQQDGLLLPFSVAANATLASLDQISRAGWILPSREKSTARKWRDALSIRLRNIAQPVRELSGGNQQKVVLAKWLQTDPQVLILDEPTRGIDIGAKAEVHKLMNELARQGKSILMISSDLPEVLAMSDRVIVMREGRVTGEFTRAEATQEKIMSAATGQAVTGAPTPVCERSEQPDPALDHPHLRSAQNAAWAPWLLFRELGIALFIVLVAVIAWIKQPNFLSSGNAWSIALAIPLWVVVAMGQMMVIISRNIDLSVGSIMGLAAMVACSVFLSHPEFPIWAATLLAIGVGAVAGLANGAMISLLRVPSIVVTLGTLSAYRGLTFIWGGGKQVPRDALPDALIRLSQTSPIFGIPWIILCAGAVAIATALFLRYTRTGREIFAIGSNPTAAMLRGIPVRRNLLLIVTISGGLAGLAGMMYASKLGYVNPRDTGAGFELIVISATVIGGTNVFGGSGSVLGTILGCLLIGMIRTALPMMNVSAFWESAVYGLAILLACVVDTFIQRRVKQ